MFGEKLIKARQNKGLSQEQLAEKLFVTRQAVSRWENGKTEPDLQTVARICNILGVQSDYFIEIERKDFGSFKYLKRIEKYRLFYEFIKPHKSWFIISVLLSLLFCASVFAVSYSIISIINTKSVAAYWLLGGAAVSVFFVITAEIILRYFCSNAFNLWLSSEKNIIRTNKFI